ncbi:MAG: sulfite exporter TauE/SafE family protein [Acetobacteraceae bacterium]
MHLYPLAGLLVGILIGLTGVGGGSLMTPLLILLFGITPVSAVGTDLLQAAVTKSAGTLVLGMGGTIAWRIVARLAAGSLAACALTIVLLADRLHSTDAMRVITVLLGAAVVLTAIAVLCKNALLRIAGRAADGLSPRRAAALTVAAGVVLGVLVTLTSVGAGALGVVILTFLYPQLPTSQIVGADIAHAVPLTLLAGLGHWWLGDIDWNLLGALLAGSVPGVVIGSLLVTRVPERVLRPVLAVALLVAGGKLIH